MALETQDSVRALGVNWDGVVYEASWIALFIVLMAREIRRIRLPLVRIEWSFFGRTLLYVFVASLGAGLISMGSPHVVVALIRVAVFAMVIGQVLLFVRIVTAFRGRRR